MNWRTADTGANTTGMRKVQSAYVDGFGKIASFSNANAGTEIQKWYGNGAIAFKKILVEDAVIVIWRPSGTDYVYKDFTDVPTTQTFSGLSSFTVANSTSNSCLRNIGRTGVWFKNKYYFIQNNDSGFGNGYALVADDATFSFALDTASGTPYRCSNLATDGTTLVAASMSNTLYYTTNGTSWSNFNIGGGAYDLHSIHYQGGRWVVIGTDMGAPGGGIVSYCTSDPTSSGNWSTPAHNANSNSFYNGIGYDSASGHYRIWSTQYSTDTMFLYDIPDITNSGTWVSKSLNVSPRNFGTTDQDRYGVTTFDGKYYYCSGEYPGGYTDVFKYDGSSITKVYTTASYGDFSPRIVKLKSGNYLVGRPNGLYVGATAETALTGGTLAMTISPTLTTATDGILISVKP